MVSVRRLLVLVLATATALLYAISLVLVSSQPSSTDTSPLRVPPPRGQEKHVPARGLALSSQRLSLRAFIRCTNMSFRYPPGPNVALASFPGSGNTWLRYLLQQATGIYTGSVYKDNALLRHGFPAESIANGSVLLVKTHEWGQQIRQNFSKAILLVRDPFAAIMAEFNRQAAGHVGHASVQKYSQHKVWKEFVRGKSKSWLETNLDWLKFEGPLHVLSYESLVADTFRELRLVLEFLGITVPETTMQCVLLHKEGIYKRSHRELKFNPFDAHMQNVIEHYVQFFATAFKMYNKGFRSQMVDFVETIRRSI